MSLKLLLQEKKSSIVNRWLRLIGSSHPAGSKRYSKNCDEFEDPEGYTIAHEADCLFHELVQDRMNSEMVCNSLDKIVRFRAIQDTAAGDAIGFIFLLKEAISEEIAEEVDRNQLFRQWLELDLRIDKMASLAFDRFMQYREKVSQLRVKEIKAEREMAFRLVDIVETAGRKRIEAGE